MRCTQTELEANKGGGGKARIPVVGGGEERLNRGTARLSFCTSSSSSSGTGEGGGSAQLEKHSPTGSPTA